MADMEMVERRIDKDTQGRARATRSFCTQPEVFKGLHGLR